MIELPAGIAGNEGGKVETALMQPAVPGATYRVERWRRCFRTSARRFTPRLTRPDPRDAVTRLDTESKGTKITVMRIPEGDGHPPLVMVYRAQLPDPPKGNKWVKVQRGVHAAARRRSSRAKAGEAALPHRESLYLLRGSMSAGKAYFTPTLADEDQGSRARHGDAREAGASLGSALFRAG